MNRASGHRFSRPLRQNRAAAAGGAEPGDPGPVAGLPTDDPGADGLDPADGLVTGHDRQAAGREVALGELEVGPADGTGGDPQDELAWWGLGIVEHDVAERCSGDRRRGLELERAHRLQPSPSDPPGTG